MCNDNTPTVVVFRMWNWPNAGVIALFPDEPADPAGRYCASFEHIGQHGGAAYSYVVAASRAATSDEYAELQTEFEARGYVLVVRKRHTGGYAVRRAKLAAYHTIVAAETANI